MKRPSLHKKETQTLLARGMGSTHPRIRENSYMCVQNTTTEWASVDKSCNECQKKRYEDELGKMGLSYLTKRLAGRGFDWQNSISCVGFTARLSWH
jgi:hypothetical protein